MALTFGFFNSVNSDRVYSAEQISEMFDGLISDGVYNNVGDAMQVVASSGLTVNVSTGRARIKSLWAKLDNVYPIIVNAAHATLNRYTAICLRVDIDNREIKIIARDGTNATQPSKPTPTRDEHSHDLILAYIYIPAGTTKITQSNIEDTRADTSVCGIVSSLVQQLNTQQLFAQYTAAYNEQLEKMNEWFVAQRNAFNTWFNDLTENLNVDTYITSKTSSYSSTSYKYDFYIPDDLNYIPGDVLMVYMGGVHLGEGTDYEIAFDTDLNKYKITVNENIMKQSMNKVFTFTVIKSKIGVQNSFTLNGNVSVTGTTLTIDND